jgi:hypothetical protein
MTPLEQVAVTSAQRRKPMTGRDVGILACRLMAIYAVLLALSMVAGSMPTIQMLLNSSSAWSSGGWLPALAAAPFLLTLAAANILWVRAERIAYGLVPYPSPQPVSLKLRRGEVETVAITLFGVFLLVHALPAIFQILWYWYSLSQLRGAGFGVTEPAGLAWVPAGVAAGVELVAGWILVERARRIGRAMARRRGGGRQPAAEKAAGE